MSVTCTRRHAHVTRQYRYLIVSDGTALAGYPRRQERVNSTTKHQVAGCAADFREQSPSAGG
jgi:hypothetical protein